MHRDNPSSECFKYVSESLSCYGTQVTELSEEESSKMAMDF